MGGFGSGRSSLRPHGVADACRSIDVNRLNRDGCLKPGWCGYWQWRDGENAVATIGMKAQSDRLLLSYNFRRHGDEWQAIEEPIPIVRVACRFGGERPYFLCPGIVDGVACNRRVAKLYGPERYFLCRHCYGLTYACQREDRLDRTRRKANKIRRRLDPESRPKERVPVRPRGMWRRTYARIRQRLVDAESEAEYLYIDQMERLIERFDRANRIKGFWE
ncbi:MAG: hypothetical protein AAGA21_03895 [Pseudomonadota bacterium]